ncbi:family S53 protease-like protein [Mycena metata]|uniref:tripeptidyl-peptidase II n=1 Tax=Mycena metata TaxID=1033252 RepID=A0AAD7NT33_9AGAR|nr:family S53 protease-like protein [Mycena metata]
MPSQVIDLALSNSPPLTRTANTDRLTANPAVYDLHRPYGRSQPPYSITNTTISLIFFHLSRPGFHLLFSTMGFKLLIKFLSLLVVVSGSMVVHEKRDAPPAGFTNLGPAPPDEALTLRVALKSSNISALQDKLLSISTPGNADFRKWLTADEVNAYVTPSAATVSAFASFASKNNLTHSVISPHGDWVSLTLPVSHANALFAANFSKFTHDDLAGPVTRTLSVSLPAELAAHVDVVHPSTSFATPNLARLGRTTTSTSAFKARKRRVNSRIARRDDSVPASCLADQDTFLFSPTCIQDIYNIPKTPATASSAGNNTLLVTAFVNEFANTADLKTFLTKFRPDISPNTTFTLQTVNNGTNGTNSPAAGDGGLEADLDIQYTIGLATGVPVTFLSVGGDEDLVPEMTDAITFIQGLDKPPTVITTSYGDDEDNIGQALATKLCDSFMSLTARGISNLFASGDGGVAGGHDDGSQCNNNTFVPTFPSTCPWVTSVGATDDVGREPAADYSSGGFSNIFPAPAYQLNATSSFISTLPSDFAGIFNHTGRGFPDVAFLGSHLPVIANGSVIGQAGTSASSPGFASVISLINDRLIAAGKPVLGFLNPWLYAGGKAGLTDITVGRNDGDACFNGRVAFDAGAGWDPITGLGTPLFDKLLAAAMK